MIDRVVRIVIGFFALGYGAKYFDPPINAVAFLIGLIILLTGAIGTCSIYSMLGLSTAGRVNKAKPAPAKSRRKR